MGSPSCLCVRDIIYNLHPSQKNGATLCKQSKTTLGQHGVHVHQRLWTSANSSMAIFIWEILSSAKARDRVIIRSCAPGDSAGCTDQEGLGINTLHGYGDSGNGGDGMDGGD